VTGITVAFMRDMMALDLAQMPPSTVAKAELCLLDYLSCAFAARNYPAVKSTLAMARAWPASAGCPVIATDLALPPAEAAYVNSVMAAAAARTDMHPAITAHCAPVIFPVAFALASQQLVTGGDFIAAVVAGYEAMARVGRVMIDDQFRRHFRATAVLGAIGGAVTAARLFKLSTEQSVSALALSANTASGLMEFGYSGEVDLFFQPANAARNAVTAALLAREGVQASRTILEGEAGLLAGFGGLPRASEIVDSPSAGFEIQAVDFKRVPACVFVQAAVHAAEAIVLRERIPADAIQRVELRTFEAAVRYPGCDDPGPIDTLPAARMSLQYAVASVLARRELTDANFTDIDNPALRALVPKVKIEIADEFTAAYPARQGAQVIVRCRSGRTIEGRVDEVPSFDFDGIVARYRRVASEWLDAPQVNALERMSLGCAQLTDVRQLVSQLGVAPSGDRISPAVSERPDDARRGLTTTAAEPTARRR
jgi:2-methylcitrate dehydratase PrpD